MPTAPRFNLNEIDSTTAVTPLNSGIGAVVGPMKWGPIGQNDLLITSVAQLRKIFGGFKSNSEQDRISLEVERALRRGTALRIINLRHYSDVNTGATAATKGTATGPAHFTVSGAFSNNDTLQLTFRGKTYVETATTGNGLDPITPILSQLITDFPDHVYKVGVSSNKLFFYILGDGSNTFTWDTPIGDETIAQATSTSFLASNGSPVFSISPKHEGAGYNNLQVTLTPTAGGNPNAFDLTIEMRGYSDVVEVYRNLQIFGGSATPPDYLSVIAQSSELITVSYSDLSAFSANAPIAMQLYALRISGASDGGTITAADYAGSSTGKSGIYALDNFTDFWQFATPTLSAISGSNTELQVLYNACFNYAATRKNCTYIAMIPSSTTTKEAAVTKRKLLSASNSFGGFFQGGLDVPNPDSNSATKLITLEGWGDILGIAGFSQQNFAPYLSFAGLTRGRLLDVISITRAYYGNPNDLEYLANNQINVFTKTSGQMYLNSAFTAQTTLSQLSYLSLRYLLIYIRRGLGEILPKYLEEPNDIPTWKQIYNEASAFIDPLISGRAIFNYEWNGDQFATSLDNLAVNNSADVQLGKYKAQLKLYAISPLQQLTVDVELAKGSGVSVNENVSQIF